MTNFGKQLIHLLKKASFYPFILLIFCVLAYAPFLLWLGFYWDDLPWVWYIHLDGPSGALGIDALHRPLAGEFLWLSAWLAGTSPIKWQIYNLVLRWLGGVSFWYLLRQIWPERKEFASLASILLILYPGFSQQFIAVNSSRHIFPLITLFTSFLLTAMAIRSNKNNLIYSLIAWILSLITMLTTEYYYGLEFVRGLIIWLVLKDSDLTPAKRIWQIFTRWSAYLFLQFSVFYWRYTISFETNYRLKLPSASQSFLDIVYATLQTVGHDILTTTIYAWQKTLSIPYPAQFGVQKSILFWAIVSASFSLALIYFQFTKQNETNKNHVDASSWLLSLALLLLSGLPFVVTKLIVSRNFPNDRLSLPFMVGASLLATSLLASIRHKGFRFLLSAIFIGLSVGVHIRHGANYKQDWETQTAFFQQLTWRIPALAPNTALISLDLPIEYASDNSLTGPLNWIYTSEYASVSSLPYLLLNLEIRTGTKIPLLEKNVPLEIRTYRNVFKGSTDQLVLIHFSPPGCVRVLNPETDRYLPRTSSLLDDALHLSNLSLILPNAPTMATLPEALYGTPQTGSWCYYFELADLARQFKNWDEVAALGDIAFKLSDAPNDPSERLPFIEAYAHVGNWERALELTNETFRIDKSTAKLLCDTWSRILIETDSSKEKEDTFLYIEDLLTCNFEM